MPVVVAVTKEGRADRGGLHSPEAVKFTCPVNYLLNCEPAGSSRGGGAIVGRRIRGAIVTAVGDGDGVVSRDWFVWEHEIDLSHKPLEVAL